MGQKSLIYSVVTRGMVVIAEYTELKKKLTCDESHRPQKSHVHDKIYTHSCNGHTFNFLMDKGFVFYVVAVESVGRQVPITFLERIKDDFNKKYSECEALTAAPKSLSKSFGPKMKEQMQYCVSHREEIDKIANVKAQADEVKEVTVEINDKENDFKKPGTKMKRKIGIHHMEIKLLVACLVLIMIIIMIMIMILIVVISICDTLQCF
ncbi:hypothetical protein R6Q59_027959 [Mikania micrantha]